MFNHHFIFICDLYTCICVRSLITSGSSQKMEGNDGQVAGIIRLQQPGTAQNSVLLSSLARAGFLDGHVGIPVGQSMGLIRPEFIYCAI